MQMSKVACMEDGKEWGGLRWWQPWLTEQMSPAAVSERPNMLSLTAMQGEARSPEKIGAFWNFLNKQLIQNIAKTQR